MFNSCFCAVSNVDGFVVAMWILHQLQCCIKCIRHVTERSSFSSALYSKNSIFEFFNKDGELEKDVKAAKLSKALIESDLKQKAYVQSNKIWTKDNGEHDSDRFNASIGKASELINFNDDNKKFRSELTILAST